MFEYIYLYHFELAFIVTVYLHIYHRFPQLQPGWHNRLARKTLRDWNLKARGSNPRSGFFLFFMLPRPHTLGAFFPEDSSQIYYVSNYYQ